MTPDRRGEVDRKRLHPRGQHLGHTRRHGTCLPLSGYSAVAHVKRGRPDGQHRCDARADRRPPLATRRRRGDPSQQGYTLYSRRTGGQVARLRPTGANDDVQVLWWRGTGWATPGDFGPLIMPLNQAHNFVTTESFFWIGA